MADPHNNAFTIDSIETRLQRLLRMQNNIDTYAVEIDVTGEKLARAHTAGEKIYV